MDNDFLKNLDSSQVRELVDSMYPLEYARGSYVIREGEAGMIPDAVKSPSFFSCSTSSIKFSSFGHGTNTESCSKSDFVLSWCSVYPTSREVKIRLSAISKIT